MKVINQVELPITPYTSTIIGCPAPVGATCIVVGDTWRSAPFKVGDSGDITTVQLYYENEPENISLKIGDGGLEFYQGHIQSQYATVIQAGIDDKNKISPIYIQAVKVLSAEVTYGNNTQEFPVAGGKTVTGTEIYISGPFSEGTTAAIYKVRIGDDGYNLVNPLIGTAPKNGQLIFKLPSMLISVYTTE